MALGRQRDHQRAKALQRRRKWRDATALLLRIRSTRPAGSPLSTAVLLQIAQRSRENASEVKRYTLCKRGISTTEFAFNFSALTDALCLSLFRFRKDDVMRMVDAISWPSAWRRTKRNRYSSNPLIVTCIILRRFCSPARWTDTEMTFGRHASQLSELFWEGIEQFLSTRGHLMSEISSTLLQEKAEQYAEAVHGASGALDNCVGFIDGTVIGIARPGDHEAQHVAYNGHKRKHALKYQAVTAPDGLTLHAYGPLEGRRHDWTLYMRSGLDETLAQLLFIDGKQYVIYVDSGYNGRVFMEVPFQRSSLDDARRAFNKAMSRVRVTVEWVFKEIKMFWTTVDYKRKMRVGESPVGALYVAAMLLTNMRNCVYLNPVSQFFKCTPPKLEGYKQM